MATLVHHAKQLNGLHAVLQSAERQRQFVEDFARDNQLIAKFYADAISQDLALRGWFVSGSLYPHQYQFLARALKDHAEDQVEEFLIIHVRGLVSDVRESATKRWRERAEIFADAFDAHIAEKYALSVPVLLAQADGIAATLLWPYLFANRNGPKREAACKSIESHLDERPLAKSFLGLLLKASGLGVATHERDDIAASGGVFSPLNRHGVLHGLDCDYATEANSLRGIALISFLDWVAQVVLIDEVSPTTK